ncbi:MAG TPA: hypothetical protein VIJ52_05330 [Pseudolabrys sp.]
MSYGVSYGLSFRDIRRQEHAFHVARRAGLRLNGFLTFSPPRSMPPEERPRKFGQYRGHLGQELAIRNGLPFVAMFFRERKLEDAADAGEHLQGLIHLPNARAMKIARSVFPDFVVIKWNDGPCGDFSRLLYLQKQRDHHAEGLVKKNRRPHLERELPAPINGRRWSLSTPLLLLAKREAPEFTYPSNKKFKKPPNYRPKVVNNPVEQIACEPQARERVYLSNAEGQGMLLGELPDMRAPERPSASPRHRDKIAPAPMLRLFTVVGNVDVIETMRGLGPTHEAIAERLGISRPQATNILNRQFRPSRVVVKRVLELAKAA